MTTENKPKKGEFYTLDSDVRSSAPKSNLVLENEEALLTPPSSIIRPPEGGIPQLAETPRLVHGPGRNRAPHDLKGGFSGYWLVSERLKHVFESVDPEAFQFAACDYVLPDGSKGPQFYLCDVVRVVFALDKDRSKFQIRTAHDYDTGRDVEIISFAGGAKLAFKHDAVGSAHAFRMGEKPSTVICDRVMYDAIRKAGIGVKASSDGLWWDDAADC
jgi:hypothetical protein